MRINDSQRVLPLVVVIVYVLAVIACIVQAFDFAGSINLNWTLVLIGLTLPWSLVSIVFVWSLIHGAGLEFFTGMYLVFSAINSLIFYWLYSKVRKLRLAKPRDDLEELADGKA
jgi:hypothetical protein